MADLAKVKRNVVKMVNQNAPESDIDSYISSEGVTIDDVRNFQLTQSPQTQVSGPVPSLSGLASRGMEIAKQEGPEFLGSMAGALATKTVPGALLSAGGSMIGEGIRQTYSDENLTNEERLKKLGWAGVRGGVGELGARAISKLATPFSGAFTKEAESQTAKALSEGITPTLGQRTSSPFLQAGERTLEYSPILGEAIRKQRMKAVDDFGKFAQRVSSELGAESSPTIAGIKAKDAVSKWFENYDGTVDKLYDTIPKEFWDTPVQGLEKTTEKMREIIARRSGVAEPSGVSSVRQWLSDILPKKVKKAGEKIVGPYGESIGETQPTEEIVNGAIKTLGDLRKLKTNIGRRTKWGDPASVGMESDMRELYGAVLDDLNSVIGKTSPDIGAELTKANEFYAEGLQTIKGKLFKVLDKSNPDDIVKIAIPASSPTQIAKVKELIGTDSFNEVRKVWLDGLINKSMTTVDGKDVLSPSKLIFNVNRYKETLPVIFADNPTAKANLDKLLEVAKLMGRGKQITEGSQTAYALTSLSQIPAAIAAVFTNPKLAAGIGATILGEGALAGGVSTEFGKRYLTSGFPNAGKYLYRAAKPTGQIGLQAIGNSLAPENK